MDPCRNTVVTEMGTKGVEMTLGHSQVHRTNHTDRMMGTADMILNPTRSYTPEMKAESRDVRTEEPRPTKRPHKFPVPVRIDAIYTYRQTVVMEPTDDPKQKERLNQAGRRARANRMIRGETDCKGSDENHEGHIRRDVPKGTT